MSSALHLLSTLSPYSGDIWPHLTGAQKRWLSAADEHRDEQAKALRMSGLRSEADRVARCPQQRGAALDHRYSETRYKLFGGCKLPKLCPWCANQRSRRIVAVYKRRFIAALQAGDYSLSLLTLTIRAGSHLSAPFAQLLSVLSAIHERRRDSVCRKRVSTECRWIAGALWSLDFSASEAGWTPHVHGLVVFHSTDSHAPQLTFDPDALRGELLCINGDVQHCNFRPVAPTGAVAADVSSSIGRCLKYASRFGHPTRDNADALTPFDRVELHRCTYRQHLIRTCGIVRDRSPPENGSPMAS